MADRIDREIRGVAVLPLTAVDTDELPARAVACIDQADFPRIAFRDPEGFLRIEGDAVGGALPAVSRFRRLARSLRIVVGRSPQHVFFPCLFAWFEDGSA